MKLKYVAAGCLLALSSASFASAAETRVADKNVLIEDHGVAPAPKGVSLGSAQDEKRYAAREATSPEAKNYRGGDVIVISATTALIILLVVLIVVLI